MLVHTSSARAAQVAWGGAAPMHRATWGSTTTKSSITLTYSLHEHGERVSPRFGVCVYCFCWRWCGGDLCWCVCKHMLAGVHVCSVAYMATALAFEQGPVALQVCQAMPLHPHLHASQTWASSQLWVKLWGCLALARAPMALTYTGRW